VVLKFPHDEVIGGAAVFERSRREAEIGKRLGHPGIQRHLNQGEQRSTEYLVLEYLRGRTLRELLMELAPTPLSAHEVLPMLLPVCEALVLAF
jgi:serine/threonine protein kinase